MFESQGSRPVLNLGGVIYEAIVDCELVVIDGVVMLRPGTGEDKTAPEALAAGWLKRRVL
jgi:hypothetical protein